jgi:hypothetical protein
LGLRSGAVGGARREGRGQGWGECRVASGEGRRFAPPTPGPRHLSLHTLGRQTLSPADCVSFARARFRMFGGPGASAPLAVLAVLVLSAVFNAVRRTGGPLAAGLAAGMLIACPEFLGLTRP